MWSGLALIAFRLIIDIATVSFIAHRIAWPELLAAIGNS
jgi:hypothetical protein